MAKGRALSKRRKIWLWIIGGVAVIFTLGLLASTLGAPETSNASTTPEPDGDRVAAASVLAASVDHYRNLFSEAQKIVGNKQYPNADAGLSALGNPSSEAARFKAWRERTGIEQDGSAGLETFKTADAHFTADTEPPAIGDWQTDIGTVQQDITQWVHIAAEFQVRAASKSELDQASSQVIKALEKADHDVSLVRGG